MPAFRLGRKRARRNTKPFVRAGRTHPRKRYKAANQKIEATPDIAKLEMAWYGRGGTTGNLRPAALKRGRLGVIAEFARKSDTRHVHTHPQPSRLARVVRGLSPRGAGLTSHPSRGDLEWMAQKVISSKLRYFHIMAVNRMGKVAGRLSLLGTRKLRNSLDSPRIIQEALESVSRRKRWPLDIRVLDTLQKDGWIKYHLTPMKGYEYKKGFFVQKR